MSAALAAGQSPQSESIARQLAAVEQQRESIRKHREGAQPRDRESFFTLSWPRPVSFVMPFAEQARAECPPLSRESAAGLAALGAADTGLPARLIGEVMRRESGYDPCAVSPAGAMGLMQLMPATASELGVRDPFDPLENVLAGSRFLRQMMERYQGDLARALGAYNAGPARVDSFGSVPPIPETRRYVGDILSRLRD
jgi:soluble lytic murein transglycosylase-like protein